MGDGGEIARASLSLQLHPDSSSSVNVMSSNQNIIASSVKEGCRHQVVTHLVHDMISFLNREDFAMLLKSKGLSSLIDTYLHCSTDDHIKLNISFSKM